LSDGARNVAAATGVLIADDSAPFRALAARLLREEGHVVAGEAADAATTLRLARSLAPAAVLLDCHLGADDGWSVACALGDLRPAPRVVMVSSDPDAGDPALLASCGAAAFVFKADLATRGLAALLHPTATAR
jgi:DNA-binding NarL/FixJ family response regulator